MPKRKLKNGEQRPGPPSHWSSPESREFVDQRLRCVSLNRGNVGGSRIPGNRMGETALGGWGGRIRTHKCRFQNWLLKYGPNFPSFRNVWRSETFPAELPKSDLHPSPVHSVHSAMNMPRRSPLRRGQAMLERRLLWIREFESSHPSQPVRSSLCDFRVCENRGHSRGLGWRAGVSSRHILEFQVTTGGFVGASLCSPFSNFRFGVPETGSICDGDRFAAGSPRNKRLPRPHPKPRPLHNRIRCQCRQDQCLRRQQQALRCQ